MSDTLHGYSKAVIRQKKKRETSAFHPPLIFGLMVLIHTNSFGIK